MWAMTDNFNIVYKTVSAKNKQIDHENQKMDDPQKFIAKGRYEKEQDGTSRVSLVYLYLMREGINTSGPARYKKNQQIHKTIDQYFDNPDIHEA